MSPSVALEYGFPSTHSTNSVSVALFFISMACEKFTPESPARLISILACLFYAASVVFGRIYCGMHSVTGKKEERKGENRTFHAHFIRLYWRGCLRLHRLLGTVDF